MKMKKFLAAGIAATLAVSSMAAVASAEEVTFDMGQTKGTIKLAATVGQEVAFLADANGQAPATLTIAADDFAVINTATATKNIKNVKIAVTGIKGTKSSSSKTYTYALTNYGDANADGDAFDWRNQKYDGSGKNWVFRAYKDTAPADSFVPSQFVEITKIELILEAEKTVTTAAAYDAWGSSTWGENVDNLVVTPFAGAQAGDILDAINKVGFTNNYAYLSFSEKSTTVDYPLMGVTDADGNKTLTRQEIGLLSYAGAWVAENGGNNGGVDGDQTYDDNGFGTNPNDFAGLASQVGDFFNKQTNGTITFKFTTAAASTGTSWQTGGVPSTQVGIKNALGAATANDFVLFFNYDQTGSLQAVTSIDANAGTITFDIAEVLDALDGKTIGVIDNIWYGMTKGVTYENLGTGLKVESITLAYDEDAADDTDIEEDDDDATIEDDDDDADVEDDDDDATVEDDDDDDYVDEDDDDDAAEVDGDNDMVDEADDDDDANPGTGVALAVVPALVAAAAVVVSKKRK